MEATITYNSDEIKVSELTFTGSFVCKGRLTLAVNYHLPPNAKVSLNYEDSNGKNNKIVFLSCGHFKAGVSVPFAETPPAVTKPDWRKIAQLTPWLALRPGRW